MMIIPAHSQSDPDDVFMAYGLPGNTRDTFRCPCPVHGGDSNSFVYYGDIQRWKCFSHHCEQEYGSNLKGLIRALGREINEEYYDAPVYQRSNQPIVFTNTPKHYKYAPNPYIPYLIHRGFFSHTVKHFEAFVSQNKHHQLYNRVVLPIRDHNNDVVGFSGRSQDPKSLLKWCHFEFKSGEVIYNFNHIRGNYSSIVLVEGPFDVWRAWEAGIHNCGCLFGTSISRHQVHLLTKYNIKRVILAMDPDKAGGYATIRKGGIFDRLPESIEVYNIRHLLANDIGDTSVNDLRKNVCPELEKLL